MSDRTGRPDPDRPDDETARRLRDVLASEAQSIHPSPDGLTQIRTKIRLRKRGWHAFGRPLAVVGAAAATAAIVAIVVVAVPKGTNGNQQNPAALDSSQTPTATPSSVSPSPLQSTGTPHQVTLYYVAAQADPQQLLYREVVTRPAPAGNAFIKDAVTTLLTTPPTDPDYITGWPQGTTVLGATIKNGTEAIIDLSAEAANGPQGLGAISAQQLFYTVQGAAPKIESVELRINGQPVTSLWGSTITDPITAQPAWQVFAHVWITSPTQGATVPAVVKFAGEAIVFEATVNWQILMNGDVLKRGSVTADAGAPDQGKWQDSVTLTPGTYELRAFEASAKDGAPTYVDTKTFTVQ